MPKNEDGLEIVEAVQPALNEDGLRIVQHVQPLLPPAAQPLPIISLPPGSSKLT